MHGEPSWLFDPFCMPNVQKHLIISGKVQGVGFRYWLQTSADQKEIFGWTRNLKSGQVEALLVGEKIIVDKLIRECKLGPPNSEVKNIEIDDSGDRSFGRSFEILETI